jgi:hypothetical protein
MFLINKKYKQLMLPLFYRIFGQSQMLQQLVEEHRFRLQEGNSNIITNLNNDIKNTYSVTNLESSHFINGRLTIKKANNEYMYLGQHQSYSIASIISNNIFTIEFQLDNNSELITFQTSSFNYKNNNIRISNIKLASHPVYDIELYYLLVDNYHTTLVESL